MSEEFQLRVEMPLDAEGFLRRACPGCAREFKWHHSESGGGEPEPEGGYFCPYCARRGEDWMTEAQADFVGAKAAEAVGEELLGGLGQGPGSGWLRIEVDHGPGVPDLHPEPDDMVRVEFACHPGEPVKVLDGWSAPVHCLLCGAAERA